MKCPTSEQLAGWQLQALSAREAARVQAHVAQCPACAQQATALAATAVLVERLPAPSVPADLWPGVAARLQARRAGWWWRAAAGFGVTASLLLGYLWLQRPAPLPTAPPDAAAYVVNHRLLAAQDPLADRASLGVLLASQEGQ